MNQGRKLGFLGVGAMGGAIARRLQLAGAQLHVYDPSPTAMESLRRGGAIAEPSPRAVADQTDIVFACLPNASVCQDAALGPEGAVHGKRLRVYVECSTIGRRAVISLNEGLAAHDITLVDAPVSGGPRAADQGKLTVMASGPTAALATLLPILRSIGPNVFQVGPEPGMAQMMKLCNNLVSAANMTAAFEAAVLGAKAGLDPQMIVDVFNVSTARNTATETKLPQAVLTGSFDFGARVDIMYKDVTLGLQEAEALGVPMWVGQNTGQIFRHAMTQGAGAQDYTTLIQFMEEWAGVQVRAKPTAA